MSSGAIFGREQQLAAADAFLTGACGPAATGYLTRNVR
jgi:hypothetical protein